MDELDVRMQLALKLVKRFTEMKGDGSEDQMIDFLELADIAIKFIRDYHEERSKSLENVLRLGK
jgi:hypothetical protein